MITTGLVKGITSSDSNHDNNLYEVELAIFKTPGNTDADTYTIPCTCSLPGGVYSSYNVGDTVYVGFINNDYSQPVILGRIYKGLENTSGSFNYLDSLKVEGNVELSKDTTISDISYTQLKNAIKAIESLDTAIKEETKTIIDARTDTSKLPTSDNNTEIMKFVICTTEPQNKYWGYTYYVLQ